MLAADVASQHFYPDRRPGEVPAFDVAAFVSLACELRSYEDALDFIELFTSLLEARITRISNALTRGDREEGETSLLGLKVSAATAGATELYDSASRARAHTAQHAAYKPDLFEQLISESTRFKHAVHRFRSPEPTGPDPYVES